MFEPVLGVSLGVAAAGMEWAFLDAAADSRVATLEIAQKLMSGDQAAAGQARLRAFSSHAGKRIASVHAAFGEAYDISCLDEGRHVGAMSSALAAIDLAAGIAAPIVVMHAGVDRTPESDRSRRVARSRASLALIARHCGETGRRLAVELLPRQCLGNTIADVRALIEGLDPAVVGVCLDTNHLMDRAGSLPGVVRQLGRRLMTLHISDYDGVDEKHWLPGRGVLDWTGFMAALSEIDYAGPFNYECTVPGDTAEARLRTLVENFDWLRGLA